MLTIHKEQVEYFNDHAKSQFIKKILKTFTNSNYEEIERIVNESISFLIKLEADVTKYVHLYLDNKSVFESKPKWMINVLDNDYYSAEDKINQLEVNLKE